MVVLELELQECWSVLCCPASGLWVCLWLNYAHTKPVGRKLSTWKTSDQEWSSGANRALMNQNQGVMVTNLAFCVRGGGVAVDICKWRYSAVLFLCAENKYTELPSRLQVLSLGKKKIHFKWNKFELKKLESTEKSGGCCCYHIGHSESGPRHSTCVYNLPFLPPSAFEQWGRAVKDLKLWGDDSASRCG